MEIVEMEIVEMEIVEMEIVEMEIVEMEIRDYIVLVNGTMVKNPQYRFQSLSSFVAGTDANAQPQIQGYFPYFVTSNQFIVFLDILGPIGSRSPPLICQITTPWD
jgi:hypothetical protein